MARPKNIYAIVDTETAGGFATPLVYDVALLICDRNGNEIAKKMWLISEVITNKKKMGTAYYKDKLPLYRKMFKADKNILVSFKQAKAEFNAMLEHYGVNIITAYNLKFDLNALKFTDYKFDYNSNGGWWLSKFFTKEYEFIDIWSMTCETIMQQVTYARSAEKYNWITDNGNISTNAENAYRYITKNYDFIESHTALSDCEIEKAILMRCIKTNKPYTKNAIVDHPWRMVQGTA